MKSKLFYLAVFFCVTAFFSFLVWEHASVFVILGASLFMFFLYKICEVECVSPKLWESVLWGLIFCILMWAMLHGVDFLGLGYYEPLMRVYTTLIVITVGLGHMSSYYNIGNLFKNSWKDKVLYVVMLINFGLSFYIGDIALICFALLACHTRYNISIQNDTHEIESKSMTMLWFGLAACFGVFSMTKNNMGVDLQVFTSFVAITSLFNLFSYLVLYSKEHTEHIEA